MNNIKVKICGIRHANNLETVIKNRAHYVGYLFYRPSPRYVDIHQAKILNQTAGNAISQVGVFVDPKIDDVDEILSQIHLDSLQFSGDESLDFLRQIKEKFGLQIIKAYGLASKDDFEASRKYWKIADIMLFDTKAKTGELSGGLGRRFDINLLFDHKEYPKRWWLAGGVNADNILEILSLLTKNIESCHLPECLDISSGVESEKGIKDNDKIEEFMQLFL